MREWEILVRARLALPVADLRSSDRMGIVDDTLAQMPWPGESAIGKRFARGDHPETPQFITVVGVVESLRLTSLIGARDPQVYLPVVQLSPGGLSDVVRTTREADPLAVLRRE